jgi:hypothetical protein
VAVLAQMPGRARHVRFAHARGCRYAHVACVSPPSHEAVDAFCRAALAVGGRSLTESRAQPRFRDGCYAAHVVYLEGDRLETAYRPELTQVRGPNYSRFAGRRSVRSAREISASTVMHRNVFARGVVCRSSSWMCARRSERRASSVGCSQRLVGNVKLRLEDVRDLVVVCGLVDLPQSDKVRAKRRTHSRTPGGAKGSRPVARWPPDVEGCDAYQA